MFGIFETIDSVPAGAEEGDFSYISNENEMFVYDGNAWVLYGDFVGGFEEVSSAFIDENVQIDKDAFLFQDVPYFDHFKPGYFYPIVFEFGSLAPLNEGFFSLSVVSDAAAKVMSISNDALIEGSSFKTYFSLGDDYPNGLTDASFSFNIEATNVFIGGPIGLSLLKPLLMT